MGVGKKQCAKKIKFVCDDCGFEAMWKSDLERHVNGVHLKIKPFNCNQCEASFTQKSHLKQHVKAIHDKLKPFKCNQCEASFSRKERFQRHVRNVHKKVIHCEKSFSEENLKSHILTVHGKIRFNCTFCKE